jgi:hypothetical protein
VLPLVAAMPAEARTPPNPYATACRDAGRVVAFRAALPPPPLTTVLPHADVAAVARVDAVLDQGRTPPAPKRLRGLVGPIPPEGCPVVRLAIAQTLKGSPPTPLVVVKPEAPYRLKPVASRPPGHVLARRHDATPGHPRQLRSGSVLARRRDRRAGGRPAHVTYFELAYSFVPARNASGSRNLPATISMNHSGT